MAAKIIITGSREFNDLAYMIKTIDALLKNYKKEVIIISGGRPGTESRGEVYANINNYRINRICQDVNIFEPEVRTMKMNLQMINEANMCICFYKKNEPEVDLFLSQAKKLTPKIINFYQTVVWHDPDKLLYTYDEL